MLDASCHVKRAPLADRGVDLHETSDAAVRALLKVENLLPREYRQVTARTRSPCLRDRSRRLRPPIGKAGASARLGELGYLIIRERRGRPNLYSIPIQSSPGASTLVEPAA
jgi:hypothetical protein